VELKRVLRPQGRLYVTVMDKHNSALVRDADYCEQWGLQEMRRWLLARDQEIHFLASDFAVLVIGRQPSPGGEGETKVFYDLEYLREHWGSFLAVVSTIPEAYGYQTAIVMKHHPERVASELPGLTNDSGGLS
jgi:hypothetical protein